MRKSSAESPRYSGDFDDRPTVFPVWDAQMDEIAVEAQGLLAGNRLAHVRRPTDFPPSPHTRQGERSVRSGPESDSSEGLYTPFPFGLSLRWGARGSAMSPFSRAIACVE